jgi:uncharacterized membrane protein YqjE
MKVKWRFPIMIVALLVLIGMAVHYQNVWVSAIAGLCTILTWHDWKIRKANEHNKNGKALEP